MSYSYCNPKVPSSTNYNYIPSLVAGVVLGVVFSLASIYLLLQGIRRRRWFLVVCIGGVAEAVGWFCRAAAHNNPCTKNIFIVQIVLLIFAPAFFSAGLYVVLAILVRVRPGKSLFKPKTYLWFFCLCDVISLVVQSLGGALAATANTNSGTRIGADIIVGGILFQVAAMTIFVALGIAFLKKAVGFRFIFFDDNKTVSQTFDRRLVWVSIIASLMIYIRNIYRAVELIQGWTGFLISHENYSIALGGVPMIVCIWALVYMAYVDSTYEKGLGMFAFSPETASLNEELAVNTKDETDHC